RTVPVAREPPRQPGWASAAGDTADGSTADEAVKGAVKEAVIPDTPAGSDEPKSVVETELTDPSQTLPPTTAPVQVATASALDMVPADVNVSVSSTENDECLAVDICIDRYLWTLYQRTPKEDTIKVEEQRKVSVKKRGKMVTVTRSSTKLVDEDFTWKDPKAAQRAGMPMMDYVIGGMDRNFKVKLFHALRAAENA